MNLRAMVDLAKASRADPAAAPPPDEPWADLMRRIDVSGAAHPVSEETYDYFRDVIPPRAMAGGLYWFAEGEEPGKLFWSLKRADETRAYFCRQLTPAEWSALARPAAVG